MLIFLILTHDISKPVLLVIAMSNFAFKTDLLEYVGSLRTLKQVEADGSLSPSLLMPMRWMVKGGSRPSKPRGGARSQLGQEIVRSEIVVEFEVVTSQLLAPIIALPYLVTNFRRRRWWCGSSSSSTFQKLVMLRSMPT